MPGCDGARGRSPRTGMTPEELQSAVEGGSIDTVVVAFTDLYGRLMGKRFDARFFLDEAIGEGTHACDYLFTVDMEMNPVPGYAFASWQQGYGDVHLVADLSTLRPAGWADGVALVLCDVIDDATHERVAVAPRSVLRHQVERMASAGYAVNAASELEFYLYDESYRRAHEQGYAGLTSAGWYIEDYHLLQGARVEPYVGAARRALRASEIPVETSKGEAGLGQHELNIRYSDALTMADHHTVMKHAMKELADAQGVSVTFMAKPHTTDTGSSSHLHVSLTDHSNGRNVFAGDGGTDLSDVGRWFLAGWMAHLRDFMVCYAPTVNSYKRYLDDSWAPTRIAWAHDNRTAGFRIVGRDQSLRIECRIPGADCNPYLAFAATLASGLAGIEQQLEPPEPYEGDVYRADHLPSVPTSLEEAVDCFSGSAVTRAAFGDDVVDHYARFHGVEARAFRAAVTDWERTRYFERI